LKLNSNYIISLIKYQLALIDYFDNHISTNSQAQQTEHNKTRSKVRLIIGIGSFVGTGYGFHNAEGVAKVVTTCR